MDRIWHVQTEGKVYVVTVDYGVFVKDPEDPTLDGNQEEGKLVIDGNEVQTWDEKLPKEIRFEIGGKPVILRKKGLFTKNLELFIEGEQIKPTQ